MTHSITPWHVESRAYVHAVVDGTGQDITYQDIHPQHLVGNVTSRDRSPAETLGNARLFAAAPDMLAALKEALPWLVLLGDKIGNGTLTDPEGRCRAVLSVRNAIDKAEKGEG
jgi:hypothetical protein